MNQRAAFLLFEGDRLLLVHRIKEGREYFVVPGGGVEESESPEEACVREAREETGLRIVLGPLLGSAENQGRLEHYYLVASHQGELRLGGPELARQSRTNSYNLEWVGPERVDDITLLPELPRRLWRDHLTRRAGAD